MEDEKGVRIALSPVQLAAVLSDRSVSEGETTSNRIFGGLGLAGGVIELFGAGALCVVPEPTMLTKAGCVFVGTHGLDTLQASLRQIWTGRQVATDTFNSAVSLAESLGADHQTAHKCRPDGRYRHSDGICLCSRSRARHRGACRAGQNRRA